MNRTVFEKEIEKKSREKRLHECLPSPESQPNEGETTRREWDATSSKTSTLSGYVFDGAPTYYTEYNCSSVGTYNLYRIVFGRCSV